MNAEPILRNVDVEHTVDDLTVEGKLPVELSGTFLRNGSGKTEVGGEHLPFFDGHGYVVALGLNGGKVTLRSRHLRTPAFVDEDAKKGLVYRRTFTNLPSSWSNLFKIDPAPIANHDIYAWGGRWYASSFPGHHHVAIDPETLATKDALFFGPKGHNHAPMPRPDPATGTIVAYTIAPGLMGDTLTFRELDANWKELRQVSVPLAYRGGFVHDVAFTAESFIAVENPNSIDVLAALWGKTTVFEAIRMVDASAEILVAPRTGGAPRRFPLPGVKTAFHVINAWQEGPRIVVDLCAMADYPEFSATFPAATRERRGTKLTRWAPSIPTRVAIDLASGTLESRPLTAVSADSPEVNPAYHGRRHRYAWGMAITHDHVERSFWADALLRLDVESGTEQVWSRPDHNIGPPAFAPRPGGTAEDDGWLLAWDLDLATGLASVVVFDARDLSAGPIATVHTGVHLPGMSHTRFHPTSGPHA